MRPQNNPARGIVSHSVFLDFHAKLGVQSVVDDESISRICTKSESEHVIKSRGVLLHSQGSFPETLGGKLVERALTHALSEPLKETGAVYRFEDQVEFAGIRLSDLALTLSDVLLDGKIELRHVPGQ